jgi:uncharacterized protein (DUF2267 family)
MNHTGISTFTHAAQQAQHWVNEPADDLGCSEQHAYRLLKSVLQTLRDWLSQEEVADLSAQLPLLIRGIYFEGWKPSESPVRDRRKGDFVISARACLDDNAGIDLDTAIGAVFGLLDPHVSHGEIVQVRNSMKKSLRDLWPAH